MSTSTYCGAFGESYAAGERAGRFLPRSIYVPQLEQQASDVTLSAADEIAAPVERPFAKKIQLGGDASLTMPIPQAPTQFTKAGPAQCQDGFVYSVYANPDFREHEEMDTPNVSEADEISQPRITESIYIREHDRFKRDAETARQRLEEANRKLAELDMMRSTTNVHASGKRVGFEAAEEPSATQVEAPSQPAKRVNTVFADSFYYGIPNNAVPAYSRPNEYHFNPTAVPAAAANVSVSHQTYAAPQQSQAKHREFAYSHYHAADLQEATFGEE